MKESHYGVNLRTEELFLLLVGTLFQTVLSTFKANWGLKAVVRYVYCNPSLCMLHRNNFNTSWLSLAQLA